MRSKSVRGSDFQMTAGSSFRLYPLPRMPPAPQPYLLRSDLSQSQDFLAQESFPPKRVLGSRAGSGHPPRVPEVPELLTLEGVSCSTEAPWVACLLPHRSGAPTGQLLTRSGSSAATHWLRPLSGVSRYWMKLCINRKTRTHTPPSHLQTEPGQSW